MKKIYSIKSIFLYLCLALLFSILSLFLLIEFQQEPFLKIIGYSSIIFSICFVVIIFVFPNYIEITNNKIKIVNFPIFATNKFYEEKKSLILWNNEISLNEVEKVKIVKLSKKEKLKYIGYNHLFNKYLKININNSNAIKYVYISIYSNKQVNEIIRCLKRN